MGNVLGGAVIGRLHAREQAGILTLPWRLRRGRRHRRSGGMRRRSDGMRMAHLRGAGVRMAHWRGKTHRHLHLRIEEVALSEGGVMRLLPEERHGVQCGFQIVIRIQLDECCTQMIVCLRRGGKRSGSPPFMPFSMGELWKLAQCEVDSSGQSVDELRVPRMLYHRLEPHHGAWLASHGASRWYATVDAAWVR